MTTVAPSRSSMQRREALDHANEIRSARARVKRDIAAGRVSVIDLLHEHPTRDCLMTAKVHELLLMVPRVGRVRALKWLNTARISPVKTLGGMTFRQRDELADMLMGRRTSA